jgi:FlaA1/EpsC-like NDP-sugar epimerase
LILIEKINGEVNFYLSNLATILLDLPRPLKRIIVFLVDASLCIATVWIAFYLRLGEWIPLSGNQQYQTFWPLIFSCLIALPIFLFFGLYRAIFRYTGRLALMAITRASLVYGSFYVAIFTVIGIAGVPRTIGLIQPIILLLALGSSRALGSYWLGGVYKSRLNQHSRMKVIIYGAGVAGQQLLAAFSNSKDLQVVGFIDDDNRIQGQTLNGITIFSPQKYNHLVKMKGVNQVILAIPSISRKRRSEIVNELLQAKITVQTLPNLSDLVKGKIAISDLQEININDLLGREPVNSDIPLLEDHLKGEVILVTGAGGSIGSELCRQMIKYGPKTILLLEQSEFSLFKIHQELLTRLEHLYASKTTIIALLGSVNDERRMQTLLAEWQPKIIYHAAAYKHVPLVETNVEEGVKNNTFGTLTLAKTALKYGVSYFVLVSTDKAVRPTSVMGASKRLAEMILQALANKQNQTKFSIVRFGNVLDSSGSVVPKFRQQIHDGGPVTVTDFAMTRFFMTIPEAALLVIQAGAMTTGGDVFLLDMGEPVRIIDLAKKMIELSGLSVRNTNNPDGDIEIIEIGLRPGEKLYEELLISGIPDNTSHPRIFKSEEEFLPWPIFEQQILHLEVAIREHDEAKIIRLLQLLVKGFSNGKVNSILSLE